MISEQKAAVSHGILLIALFSFSAFYISEFQWVKDLSLSPLIVGIILGMLYANSLRNYIPETWVPGIKFCTKQILRTGIVLYGFRLTFQQVLAIGLPAIIIDVIVIFITLLLGVVAGRLLKMDEKTSLMVSTGSAICGAAAVLCPAQDSHRRVDGSHLRYALDVSLPHSLPCRHLRPLGSGDGHLLRCHPA